MSTPQQPTTQARKRYRLAPSGCCDMPRTVHLTDAEAAPGKAKGLLTLLPDVHPAAPPPPTSQPHLPRSFQP